MQLIKTYRFLKSGNDWYIDLPECIEQGGTVGDLKMVDGADTMLDMMAVNDTVVTLTISDTAFEGADELALTEKMRAGYWRRILPDEIL